MRPQRVPVRAYEAPEALVVIAPMPCVQPGDVRIELRQDTLRFWSHLRSAAPREYLIDEWDFGGFEREIRRRGGSRRAFRRGGSRWPG